MTAAKAALIAAAVTGLFTLLGSLVTGIATYKAGKKRVKGEVIGASRQEWISNLRDCLAEFQSILNLLNASLGSEEVLSSSQQNEKMNRAQFLRSKAELLLNPNEEEHRKLVDKMEEALKVLLDIEGSEDDSLTDLQDELTKQAQVVMKDAWEQIKNDIE